jgi:hypothetical protein
MVSNESDILIIQLKYNNMCINKKSQQQIKEAAKQVVHSRESACMFLKSAGIMTSKGNLSPKYK